MRIVVVAIAPLGLIGCRSLGPIGSGGPSLVVPTYAYASGTASQGFASPRPEVEGALSEAMTDLDIIRVGLIEADSEQTLVRGRASDGRRVDLSLVDRGAATEARVRVGLFGDERLAKAVLDRVGVRLGTLPPEATPAEVPASGETIENPYFSKQAVPDSVMLRGFSEGIAPGGTSQP
ncbi:DUF3568 family protein [Tautonia plasticadhaerens]|uniref:DUF3568 family protein n=1 Tax=Tautonia plasticadhaerens TaxID=2527974 RepID=A0A518GXC9_9BACT|nr:DUF3568 family protein [Tautonia plasticadhaerens]QDV33240.1 hypothetical protein ElP_10820 [Tautonia plasticadhaerens]